LILSFFLVVYSYRDATTAFEPATRRAWVNTVPQAMNSASMPAAANGNLRWHSERLCAMATLARHRCEVVEFSLSYGGYDDAAFIDPDDLGCIPVNRQQCDRAHGGEHGKRDPAAIFLHAGTLNDTVHATGRNRSRPAGKRRGARQFGLSGHAGHGCRAAVDTRDFRVLMVDTPRIKCTGFTGCCKRNRRPVCSWRYGSSC